jgi:hypothetical protein
MASPVRLAPSARTPWLELLRVLVRGGCSALELGIRRLRLAAMSTWYGHYVTAHESAAKYSRSVARWTFHSWRLTYIREGDNLLTHDAKSRYVAMLCPAV